MRPSEGNTAVNDGGREKAVYKALPIVGDVSFGYVAFASYVPVTSDGGFAAGQLFPTGGG
ncbi:MAG: hypothetical protein QXW94_05485 [Desulfurococcaceae archaeon]